MCCPRPDTVDNEKLYHDALCTLNDNPAHGMASPSLFGSSGMLLLESSPHLSSIFFLFRIETSEIPLFWLKQSNTNAQLPPRCRTTGYTFSVSLLNIETY